MFVETMDVDVQNQEIFNVWKGRIWAVNGITNHFQVVRNDMKLCADIINAFDMRSGLLQSINCEHPAFDRVFKVVFSGLEETSAEENSRIHIQLLKVIILLIKLQKKLYFYVGAM